MFACVGRKSGTGGGGWGHLQGAVHRAAGGPIFTLAYRVLLSPCRGFISGREGFFGAELIFAR